jgi:hypothetical protein
MITSDQYAGTIYVADPDKVTLYFPHGMDSSAIADVMSRRFSGDPLAYVFWRIPPAVKAAAVGLGITAALALAAWGFFRGVGWMLAGFARDLPGTWPAAAAPGMP